jgi:hypothetical protein
MAKTENAVEMRAADSDSSLDGFHGSSEDAKDMYRLGRSQELKVCCIARPSPVTSWRNTGLLATEKLPLRPHSRLDMCNHVYMDGHLVVGALTRHLTGVFLTFRQNQHFLPH